MNPTGLKDVWLHIEIENNNIGTIPTGFSQLNLFILEWSTEDL